MAIGLALFYVDAGRRENTCQQIKEAASLYDVPLQCLQVCTFSKFDNFC